MLTSFESTAPCGMHWLTAFDREDVKLATL